MNFIDWNAAAPADIAVRKSHPRVLLVTEDAPRRAALLHLLRGLAPDAHLESDADSIDALLSAARMQADLVLVDAALAMGAATALARHLARVAPQATVLVLDTPAAPRDVPGALHWTDLLPACERWLARWRVGDGARPGPGPDALALSPQ